MKKITVSLLMLMVFLVGCSTANRFIYGKDFDEVKRTQIVKGVSSKDDVKNIYGEPADRELNTSNNETWTYLYKVQNSEVNLWNYDTTGTLRLKKLIVSFDQNDKVINYVYSDTLNPISDKKK